MTRAQARRAYKHELHARVRAQGLLLPDAERRPRRLRLVRAAEDAPAQRAQALQGSMIWISTSNSYFAVGGIRPRAPLSLAGQKLKLEAPFHIGLNQWYLAPNGSSIAVLKVRERCRRGDRDRHEGAEPGTEGPARVPDQLRLTPEKLREPPAPSRPDSSTSCAVAPRVRRAGTRAPRRGSPSPCSCETGSPPASASRKRSRTDVNAAVIEAAISSGRMSCGSVPRSFAIDSASIGSSSARGARAPSSAAPGARDDLLAQQPPRPAARA